MPDIVIPREKYLELYASMYYTKQLEKMIWDFRMLPGHESPIPTVVLNSWWEWAIGAAVAAAMDPATDYLVPGHRSTAAITNFFLRAGKNFARPYLRNHFGTMHSPSSGWNLNVHYGFPELHIFPFHSDMAANAPAAAGIGFALKRLWEMAGDVKKQQGVAAVFFGEGAFNQGLPHEALTFIGANNLPVLVVIDKNNWSTYTPYEQEAAIEDLSDRAYAYGLAKLEVKPGFDAVFLYRKVHDLVERARIRCHDPLSFYDTKAGALIVVEMERGAPHNVQMDVRHSFRAYQHHQVYAENLARDPVDFLRRQLVMLPKLKAVQAQADLRRVAELKGEDLEFTEEELRMSETRIDQEIALALEQVQKEPKEHHHSIALRGPYPRSLVGGPTYRGQRRTVEALDSYWRGSVTREEREEARRRGQNTKFVDAHRAVMDRELALNPLLHAWGEDYGEGDVYGQLKCAPPDTRTLQEKYGTARIFSSNLAEGLIYGSAEGAAFAGIRPVVGVQYLQFGWSGVSALISGLAPRHQLYGVAAPVTIIMPSGEGITAGHHHAALHLKTALYHLQMLKVVEPTTVRDLAGLLRSALRDNAPVIVVEGISAYENVIGAMPKDDDFMTPIGEAVLRQEGVDLTILSWGAWVTWNVVSPALGELLRRGVSVEWIDARTLVPMDYSLIFDSVAKTRRLLIVHAEGVTGGIGQSVAAKVLTEPSLRGLYPMAQVVAARDGATPQAPAMERAYLPSVEKVLVACRELLGPRYGDDREGLPLVASGEKQDARKDE